MIFLHLPLLFKPGGESLRSHKLIVNCACFRRGSKLGDIVDGFCHSVFGFLPAGPPARVNADVELSVDVDDGAAAATHSVCNLPHGHFGVEQVDDILNFPFGKHTSLSSHGCSSSINAFDVRKCGRKSGAWQQTRFCLRFNRRLSSVNCSACKTQPPSVADFCRYALLIGTPQTKEDL